MPMFIPSRPFQGNLHIRKQLAYKAVLPYNANAAKHNIQGSAGYGEIKIRLLIKVI